MSQPFAIHLQVHGQFHGVPPTRLRFAYTNWRGITEACTVEPREIIFGIHEWHPDAARWLLKGLDLDRSVEREFVMRDMRDVELLP